MSSYYLGAAIDLSTENPFDIMSEKVRQMDPACIIFRPDRAYNNAAYASVDSANYLKKVNDFALLSADIAIFYISSKIFSMGAALEIQERANMHKKDDTYPAYYPRELIGHIDNKKTIVITDKAGLYLKVQQSKNLLVYTDSDKIENVDIAKIIKSM